MGDAERSAGPDHRLFEEGDVGPGFEGVGAEVEDWVGDELAGAVIGQVAAAGAEVEGCEGGCLA